MLFYLISFHMLHNPKLIVVLISGKAYHFHIVVSSLFLQVYLSIIETINKQLLTLNIFSEKSLLIFSL